MSSTSALTSHNTDRCVGCSAREYGPCGRFDQRVASEISAHSTISRFPRGAEVLSQGEPMERVGILTSGLVKIAMLDEHGEERVLQILHPGEIIGDPFAEDCAFTYEAATEIELCWTSPKALERIFEQYPVAYGGYLGAILRQLEEHQLATIAMRGRNTLQRLAYWLYLQTPEDEEGERPVLHVLLSRRDLASLLDMTVETLCRALRQLDDRGAIDLLAPDKVRIVDAVKLRIIAKAQDTTLHHALNSRGWEWGARRMEETSAEARPAIAAALRSSVTKLDAFRRRKDLPRSA